MTRSFPHLGFDPAPGDVEQTRGLARQIGNLSADLNTTVIELAEIDVADWKGKAAQAFRSHVEHDVQPLIVKAYNSFDRASSALNSWANSLQEFQHEADGLEREAAQHQADLDHAKSALNTPPPSNGSGTPNPSPSGTDHQDKQKHQAVTDAGNALDGVRRRAHDLHDRYTRTAKAIASQLDKAGHIAPEKPGLFHEIASGIEHAWNATTDWIKDHADLIKFVSDILGDISGVLGVLAIITAPFEPLGAIFAGAALATGALSLVGDLVAKAAGANVSWLSIGLGALGVIPGIGVFAKGARVADGAVAAARAAELGEGFRGASTIGRNIVGIGDKVAGDLSFTVKGKTIGLWGYKAGGIIKTSGGLMNRMKLVSEAGYNYGQTVGVKGLSLLTRGKVAVDPMSGLGRAIDSTVKIGSKAIGIPGQIQDGQNLGDHFQHAATAH